MTVRVGQTVECYYTPEDCYFPAVRGQVITLTETHARVAVNAVIPPNEIGWQEWRQQQFTVSLPLQKVDPVE